VRMRMRMRMKMKRIVEIEIPDRSTGNLEDWHTASRTDSDDRPMSTRTSSAVCQYPGCFGYP
jgi:hypothetical protein